eukprot:1700394-Pleurochrysis_carterae.AAC.2
MTMLVKSRGPGPKSRHPRTVWGWVSSTWSAVTALGTPENSCLLETSEGRRMKMPWDELAKQAPATGADSHVVDFVRERTDARCVWSAFRTTIARRAGENRAGRQARERGHTESGI